MMENREHHISVADRIFRIQVIAVGIFILCVFVASLSMADEGKDTILWLRHDTPPAWILQGANADRGAEDLLRALFIEKLSGYDHKVITVNHNRAKAMMTDGDHVCQTARFKTRDREEYMHYSSVPSSISLGIGMMIHKNKRSQIGQEEHPSLADILQNKKLTLGVVENRKYGKKIDDMLDNPKKRMFVYKRSKGDFWGLFEILRTNRVDIILGHDWELQYIVSKFWPKETDDYIFLPVQEAVPYVLAYMTCPKTDWGKQLIRKINKIILDERKTDRFRNFWLQWVSASNKELHNRYYDDIFLKYQEE